MTSPSAALSVGRRAVQAALRLRPGRRWSPRAVERVEGLPSDADVDYKALVEQVPAITYISEVGIDGEWRFTSPQVYPILGFTPEEFTTDLWLKQVHPDDIVRLFDEEEALLESRDDGQTQVTEYRILARDGRIVWVSDEYVLFRSPEGEHLYRGVLLDITKRKEIQQAADLQERRFRSLVQDTSDVIAVFDAGATIDYISPSVEKVLGFHPHEQVGTSSLALVHPHDLLNVRKLLSSLSERPGDTQRTQLRLRHKEGHWRWIEMTITNLLHDPSVGGLVSNYRDVTDRKNLEDQLRHRALHDPLTGLANRALLVDRLGHSMARSKRLNRALAVLFIDLDGFKVINDTFGHAAGDDFLVQTAQRMQSCLRSNDTAARVGGDEFVVLLEEAGDIQDTAATAARILAAIRAPFTWEHAQTCTPASIGIAFCDSGQDSVEQLLHNADGAMYKAKAGGKGRYEIYEPDDPAMNPSPKNPETEALLAPG